MNIVFYLLVIIALVALWFTLTFAFKPFGRYLYRVYKDTKDVMTECDKADIEKEKEN
jgi:hypothetical protein